MGILLWISRQYEDRLKPGDIFLTYLVIFPLGRFLIEFLRLDSSQVAGLNANQTIMLIIALVAGGMLILRHRFQKDATIQKPLIPTDGSIDSSKNLTELDNISVNEASDEVSKTESGQPNTENSSEVPKTSTNGEKTNKDKTAE